MAWYYKLGITAYIVLWYYCYLLTFDFVRRSAQYKKSLREVSNQKFYNVGARAACGFMALFWPLVLPMIYAAEKNITQRHRR